MPRTVYPVGRYRGITRTVVAELKRRGYIIVHDWTKEDPGGTRRSAAVEDLYAATHCDVVLLMWTDGMKGAWVEVGAALAVGALVIAIDAKREDCIFLDHPGVEHVRYLEDAIALMEKLNGKT